MNLRNSMYARIDNAIMGVDCNMVDMKYSTFEICPCMEFRIWKSEECINIF